MLFPRSRAGFGPYRLDLDVYRIGGRVWLHGGNLYGALPPTASGVRLPFSYPPVGGGLAVAALARAHGCREHAAHAGHDRAGRAGAAGVPAVASVAGTGSWWTAGWLLPAALFLEPVRSTLSYGQVNVVLMALVALDCLADGPRGRAARWSASRPR